MTKFIYGNKYYKFIYNDQGLRIRKENHHGGGTDYIYDGDKLITEISSKHRLDFLYDENGSLYGFIKDMTEKYLYIRDSIQNILGIIDIKGNLMVKYKYDAWGQILEISGSNVSLGRLNPFKYKGYYYDSEIGMYYCKSRYYLPEWGRWLNADNVYYLDYEEFGKSNFFIYCSNNPILYLDKNGTDWWNPLTWNWKKIGKGIGLVITGVAAVAIGIATMPFGGGIAIVAGITAIAGAGTAIFGVSDIGEGVTDYNLIKETVFAGNEQAYYFTEQIFKDTAIVGSMICGIYGASNTVFINDRKTPRLGKPHSGRYNEKFKTFTYYGKNGEMKYSMHIFNKRHQWIHWHTELPHSKPINNVLKFILEMIKRGF